MKRIFFVFILILPLLLKAQIADTARMRQIAFEQLRGFNPFYGHEYFENKVINFYYGQSGDIYLLTSTNLDGDCHACGVHLSLIVFDKNLTLKKAYLDFVESGAWGGAPDTSFIKFYCDQNRYLLAIGDAYTSGGYTEGYTSIYAPLGEKLIKIGSFQFYHSNYGVAWEDKDLVEWDVKYAFIPLKNNYPDIICHKTGTDKGKKIDQRWRLHYVTGKGYIKN